VICCWRYYGVEQQILQGDLLLRSSEDHSTWRNITSIHYTAPHLISHNYTSHHFTTHHFGTLHITSLHFASVHFITLHITSLHFTTRHFTALHFTTRLASSLHFIKLHFTTFHFNTLHSQFFTSLNILLCMTPMAEVWTCLPWCGRKNGIRTDGLVSLRLPSLWPNPCWRPQVRPRLVTR
jgi:hypothetical protein